MKKFLFILLAIVMSALLVACGGKERAGDTNNAEIAEGEEVNTEETQNTEFKPSLEIVQSTGGSWKDSIDAVWVHSAAIFENTGDVPVKIGETQMNFKGKDESILGTAPMIYSVPSIVGPGELAYISETTILQGVNDPKEYAETSYNFNFDVTEEDPNLLEVSGVKGVVGDEYTPYIVTGVITNTTDELQDDIRISAALLGEDGNVVGILQGSIDVGVNPGSEAGFELSYPEIPKGVVDLIDTVEVIAYGWNW